MVDLRERTPEVAVGEADELEPALKGLRVVELASGVAGPYCGKMFADFGADVVKVELPEGDPSRAVGPFPEGDRDAGALFLWLNANKRGITLDWRKPAGRKVLRELIAQADVLVDSGPTAFLNRLRLGPRSLLRLNPHLVVTSVTPFGRTGPWRDRPATDLTVSALAGMSFINGVPGQEPLREPGPQTEVVAGVFAYVGALAALADRTVTGQGQAVDLSGMEAILSVLTPYITQLSYQGSYVEPGVRSTPLYRCADGYMSIIPAGDNAWQFIAGFLKLGSAAEDPSVATETERTANIAQLREILEARLKDYTKLDLFAAFINSRVNIGMVMSIPELKADQHLEARRYFASVADPRASDVIYPGPPFRMGDCEWRIGRPAPSLGEHNEEVLSELLGRGTRRPAALRRAGAIGGGEVDR